MRSVIDSTSAEVLASRVPVEQARCVGAAGAVWPSAFAYMVKNEYAFQMGLSTSRMTS